MNEIKLGDTVYPVSYNWEAIEGIQSDLEAESLDNLYKTISGALTNPDGVTQKDLSNVMRIAKIVIYHGLRGAALENDTVIPFKTPSNVGARMRSFSEAGKQLGLFAVAMNALFTADPEEDMGKKTGEAATP